MSPLRSWDVPLLFATRVVRMFAYGCVSLILVLYLAAVGLSDGQIGLLLTMTLVGDTVLSLWITTAADRVGRKRMLIAGAALMVLGGAVFATTGDFVPLLLAATVGVISPSDKEVGPFLAIEQAALAEIIPAQRRTRTFAWYHLAGALATAAGALTAGVLLQFFKAGGTEPVWGFRVLLFGYTAAGALLAALFLFLSPSAEAAGWPGLSLRSPGESERDFADAQPRPPARWLGLRRSRGVVLRLSALFALDAFAGGFVLQSVMAYWFHERFGADPATLGGIFFGANVLSAFSALAAAAVARRAGLVNTMVFTHAPSNVLLILVPLMPSLSSAVAVLLARFAISQMDVPARQSYTAAVVDADERSAAAGVTGVARTAGASLAPVIAGLLLGRPGLSGIPFVIAGGLKLIYDAALYRLFRHLTPPEERLAGQDTERARAAPLTKTNP